MRRIRKDIVCVAAEVLADETEAFLHGCALELCIKEERCTPAWCRLNRIAHCDEQLVRELAGDQATPGDSDDWQYVEQKLAEELLSTSARSIWTCRYLQNTCLIPLELAMIRAGKSVVFSPQEVIELARQSLHAIGGRDEYGRKFKSDS